MTKQLASINKKNLKLGDKRKFQVVLVGYDQNDAKNESYLKDSKLGCPAVKLKEKASLKELLEKGDTGFIPNIVLLKPDGSMVSNDKGGVLKKLEKLAAGK